MNNHGLQVVIFSVQSLEKSADVWEQIFLCCVTAKARMIASLKQSLVFRRNISCEVLCVDHKGSCDVSLQQKPGSMKGLAMIDFVARH